MCCSGRAPTAARGTRIRARWRRTTGTSRCCSGRARPAARGTRERAGWRYVKGIATCSSGRASTGARRPVRRWIWRNIADGLATMSGANETLAARTTTDFRYFFTRASDDHNADRPHTPPGSANTLANATRVHTSPPKQPVTPARFPVASTGTRSPLLIADTTRSGTRPPPGSWKSQSRCTRRVQTPPWSSSALPASRTTWRVSCGTASSPVSAPAPPSL